MLIQVGHNSYRIIKKRIYKRRTLLTKRKGKSMIAYILGSFTVLTLLTAGVSQIPPNIFTWTSNDSFVDGKINLDNGGSYYAPINAPEASRIDLKAKAVIIETPKKLTPSETEALIRKLAKEAKFPWENWLVKIAVCESHLNPKNSNTGGNYPKGSIDRGLFMINSYWHSEVTDEQAYDPVFSTKFAMDLTLKGRQSEFVCDSIIKNKK